MLVPGKNRGISILDVLVSFAVTSVLVAVAMPNFQDYSVRAKVIAGLEITEAAKAALVATCKADEKAVVKSNQDAGFRHENTQAPDNFVEKIVLAADCAKKDLVVMVWTRNTGAGAEPILELTARVPSGVTAEGFEDPYGWHCRIIRGEFGQVPSDCRKRYRKT